MQREDGPAIAKLLAGVDGGPSNPLLDGIKAGKGGVIHLPAHLALKIDEKTEATRFAATGMMAADAMNGTEGEHEIDISNMDMEDLGPVHYAHKLHQAGEAAIQIVCNMADAEFAMGNPNNIPEALLGWYVMVLTYQLCVLEAVGADEEALEMHADQLRAAISAFKRHKGAYGDGVREEIEFVLANRKTFKGDGTYGGKL